MAEIPLDETIKSINSEANNKSVGKVGLTAELYKHFSSELAPFLLDVYDSWENLDTMGITFRIEIIFAIYTNDDKKDVAKYRPISLLNLNHKFYTTFLKNRMQKTLDTRIGEHQSEAIKN